MKCGPNKAYEIFELNKTYLYRIGANVTIIPDVHKHLDDPIEQWSTSGVLEIQRIDQMTLAMQFNTDDTSDDIKPLRNPFKMKSLSEKESSLFLMQHPQKVMEMIKKEPIWSANIKRAIASLFQLEGNSENGAYVSNEFGLYGLCQTEYYVVNNTDALMISKIYDMDRCSPYPGGIFDVRSNIPLNMCEEKQPLAAMTSRLGDYKLMKLPNSKYLLKTIKAETKSNVQATESYYPQFIFTKVTVDLESNGPLVDKIKFNETENTYLSEFTYVPPKEATGGRAPKSSEQILKTVNDFLLELANRLEDVQLNFDEPYMEIVSEIVRLIETMDYETLKKLYDQIDIGTSYLQETSRNIFLEILPRVGTAPSVLLTKYLVMEKHVRPTTAVQLLISLPFFISELSADLVKECEEFLHVGNDRPDVKHSAVLSYATIIYKAFVARAITADQFEKYVKSFFDLFLSE
jgi:Lipoprotein amino terminal region